ncbi:site-specific integrase [Stackebrandtia nassauensis]|uniref:Integrase family protein n=1 Tax=Stackebrandtia nassauensis (strain DSM 44728 / CIP 108903 / NRRL B-16338 / NBRC 102104 / LLR-40K-21) TaxID=446470 RepID=D3Q4L2_STANL|nr:tyrosine-type recombinase/integrase [Stackebrandtia nassauensis]ADD40172.1 integrase family protein [Stackebrandtia nassauensis DSM 44728]
MAGKGVIFKRCGCRNSTTGKRLLSECPRLSERGHGSWYFHCSVVDLWGRHHRIRRGGFASRAAATTARDTVVEQSAAQATGSTWTVTRWLRFWLAHRQTIRPTTARSYQLHIDLVGPYLDKVSLAGLTCQHLTEMFAELAARPNRHGRPCAAGTWQRVRATLRAALNGAIREGLIDRNAARHVELANPHRPHAVVWTADRVEAWRRTGIRPAVAVWTAAQLVRFLDCVQGDREYVLWSLIAFRGMRRGEAAGLRWMDVDLDRRQLMVTQQLATLGRAIYTCPPKSRSSRRIVALDRHTVALLREHAERQRREQRAAGYAWHETGYVFTRPDGRPHHPDYLTSRFRILCDRHDLPPIRLHDLRHGAASLAHTAGADLKTVQEQLGHGSIVLTADTYTSVLPQTHHAAAAATARLILDTARATGRRLRQPASRREPKVKAEPCSVAAGPVDSDIAKTPSGIKRDKRHGNSKRKRRQRRGNHRPHKKRRG